MELSIAANLSTISFFAAIAFTGFFRTIAKYFNILIDLPDKNRKFHKRPTPLVGGLGIHMAMLFGLLMLYINVDMKFYDQERSLSSIKSSFEVNEFKDKKAYEINAEIIGDESLAKKLIEVYVKGQEEPLRISLNESGHFEYLAPNGRTNTYKYENGEVINIDTNEQVYVEGKDDSSFFAVDETMLAIILAAVLFQIYMLRDDLYGMTQIRRLLIQSLASLIVIIISGEFIKNIGFEVFDWNGDLGSFGIPFTIFAVTGIINAFNMIDGINGLCSGLALVVFVCLSVISGGSAMTYGLLIIMSSIIGFMIYNLGFVGKKRSVFLGDNGSNFLGFIIAWSCIHYSSSQIMSINPITALWLVAIPLWDCILMICYRVLNRRAVFEGDRNHIHHIIYDRFNFSENMTLLILLILGLILGLIGLYFDQNINPLSSLLLFILCGVIFGIAKHRIATRVY